MSDENKKTMVSLILQHPQHKKIYSSSNVSNLMESIQEVGLLQPIIVNNKMQVLCGWRRVLAITELGWKEVELIVIDIPKDEEAAFMVNSNAHRQKTNVEIYNELKVLKEYWAKKPGTRTDLMTLPDDERPQTRSRIAEAIGVSESRIQKIEFIGDKDLKMLELVDNEKIGSLHEAYTACNLDKPLHEKPSEEIDLTKMKLCPCCEHMPWRIVNDENGNLTYSIL